MKTVYYLTVEDNREEKLKEHREISFRKRKEPLPIYKCSKIYRFAEGAPSAAGNPVAGEEVQIYCSILPHRFFQDMKKAGKRKSWIGKISCTLELAESMLDGSGSLTVLFSRELCEIFQKDQEIAPELYGVLVFNRRKEKKFTRFSISIPEDHGPLLTENVIGLIEPYLAGIETVTFVGRESESTWDLEDFLGDEYGIVMCYEDCPAANSLWLDLGKPDGMSFPQTVLKREIYHINDERILKFLDTTVKSGYNTKVN